MSDADNSTTDPLEIGYLNHDFGILLPEPATFKINKQSGGVSCYQDIHTGTVLPLGRPSIRQGYPEWLPDTDGGLDPDEDHPVTDIDLASEIPKRDYESLPDWVQDRGHFYSWDEFMHWLDSSEIWWHWNLDLISELKQWNYDPTGEMAHVDRDMTEMWDSLDDIWNAIDECLSFTYDEYDYHAAKMEAISNDTDPDHPLPDDTVAPCEGVRWITITGSKQSNRGEPMAPWADQLEGETVVLLYPNSD